MGEEIELKWYAGSLGYLFCSFIVLTLIYFGLWASLYSPFGSMILLLSLIVLVGFPLVVFTLFKFTMTIWKHM